MKLGFWSGIGKPLSVGLGGASAVTQKTATIDNTGNGNTLTNYQVKVTVTWVAGMQADFSDIRFRDADNTTSLSFWIESYTASTSATVWVKVPTIAASASKNIYLHWGNTAAAGGSSGDNAMTLFEDFVSYKNPLLAVDTRYSMVRKIGSTYYMIANAYSASPTQYAINLYTSVDPLGPWYAYASNPIVPLGAGGSWEDARLAWGTVGKEGATYYMYYGGFDGSAWGIGLATSSDLISWTKDGGNPIFAAGTDPALLTDLDGNIVKYNNKYWMTRKDTQAGAANYIMSADNIGGPWTEAALGLTVGANGAWDDTFITTDSFIYDGTNYYIFYRGTTDGTVIKTGVASCSTPNGTFVKSASNPLIAPVETWEQNEANACTVVKFDSTYYMYYTGGPTNNNIGVATASAIGGPYTKQRITAPLTITTGTPTFTGSILTLNGSAPVDSMVSATTYTYKACRFRANYEGTNGDGSNLKHAGFINGSAGARTIVTTQRSQTKLYLNNFAAAGTYEEIAASVANAYKTFELRWKSGEVKAYIDDTLALTSTSQVPSSAINVTVKNLEDTTNNLLVDWIAVREYSDPEPTVTVS